MNHCFSHRKGEPRRTHPFGPCPIYFGASTENNIITIYSDWTVSTGKIPEGEVILKAE
jgi:hypothetical protein